MRSRIELSALSSMADARAIGLPVFARSFDHELQPAFPVIIARRDGQLRAYAQTERRWLVTPAIHTTLNSPRDTYEICKLVMEYLRQTAPGFLIQATFDKADVFTEPVMDKLGLKPWPYRVFYSA